MASQYCRHHCENFYDHAGSTYRCNVTWIDAVRLVGQHRVAVLSGIVSYVRLVLVLGEPYLHGMREDMWRRLLHLWELESLQV